MGVEQVLLRLLLYRLSGESRRNLACWFAVGEKKVRLGPQSQYPWEKVLTWSIKLITGAPEASSEGVRLDRLYPVEDDAWLFESCDCFWRILALTYNNCRLEPCWVSKMTTSSAETGILIAMIVEIECPRHSW